MDTIGSRISFLIQTHGITKTTFASKMNLSQGFVSQICSDARLPSDRTILDVCREFRVNEQWLRTGEGPMNYKTSRTEQIASFMSDVMAASPDDVRQVLVGALSQLDADDWEAIRNIFKKTGLI